MKKKDFMFHVPQKTIIVKAQISSIKTVSLSIIKKICDTLAIVNREYNFPWSIKIVNRKL